MVGISPNSLMAIYSDQERCSLPIPSWDASPTFCYYDKGGESYADLPYMLDFANLPPDASPLGRLGQPLKERSPDVLS